MKFSLLCPTRERIGSVERLLASLKETVGDPENVEILFGCDIDDMKTVDMLKKFIEVYKPIQIKYFIRTRSDFINGDYYNWLAGLAKGDFLHVIGDDCVYTKMYWDKLSSMRLDDYLKDKLDRIVYGMVDDGTPAPGGKAKEFCCFPVLSREAYKTLGFVLHGEIPTWGADTSLYDIFSSPRVNRILNLQDIILKHISHHCSSDVKRDNTSLNIEKTYLKYSRGQILGRIRRLVVPENINTVAKRIAIVRAERAYPNVIRVVEGQPV